MGEKPLLIHRRKFDVRAYCLVVQEAGGGPYTAYFFQDAYLRTTSAEYTTKTFDRLVHLNNDAVQSKGQDYGKYEPANKLSLADFQKYLDVHHDKQSVARDIIPQIKSLMADTVRATYEKLNPRNIDHCFEIFGFDFMIDSSFRVWLIEVNTNPCLALCNANLSRLIPNMLAGAFQLTLDRVFPQGLSRSTSTSLSSSTSPSEACCPAGHVLTDHLTPVPGYCCDACGRKFLAKTHLWGCRRCDYYHCSECCTNVPLHEPNELENGWERIFNSADDANTPSCAGLRSSSNGKKPLGYERWL